MASDIFKQGDLLDRKEDSMLMDLEPPSMEDSIDETEKITGSNLYTSASTTSSGHISSWNLEMNWNGVEIDNEESPPIPLDDNTPENFYDIMQRITLLEETTILSDELEKDNYTELMKHKFFNTLENGEAEASQKRAELENEEVEKQQLLETIEELRNELKSLTSKYESESKQCKADVEKAAEKAKEAKEELRKVEVSLSEVKQIETKNLAKYRRLKDSLGEEERKRDRIDQWLNNHGIKFVVPDSEEEGEIGEKEIMVKLKSMHPDFPDEECFIRMNFMNFDNGTFQAVNVYPPFDDAFELVQGANESQDFIKFVLECKKRWKNVFDGRSPTGKAKVGNQTAPLFESPSSTTSDMASSPSSD